ncbi:hypothetical protein AHF37_00450 [Paragonimus kellicotti]|nr:hypothetical protein AHF37_00450 [Paragonimus kellicotti]
MVCCHIVSLIELNESETGFGIVWNLSLDSWFGLVAVTHADEGLCCLVGSTHQNLPRPTPLSRPWNSADRGSPIVALADPLRAAVRSQLGGFLSAVRSEYASCILHGLNATDEILGGQVYPALGGQPLLERSNRLRDLSPLLEQLNLEHHQVVAQLRQDKPQLVFPELYTEMFQLTEEAEEEREQNLASVQSTDTRN